MINIKDTYVTLWKPEVKEKYTKLQISTSRKNKEGEGYTNQYFNAKLVGKANVPVVEKQRIKITNGLVENKKWENNGETKYFTEVTIFEFEAVEKKEEPNSSSDYPKCEDCGKPKNQCDCLPF